MPDLLKGILFNRHVICVALVIAMASLHQPLYFNFSTHFGFLVSWYAWAQGVCFVGALVAYLAFGKKDVFPALVALLIATCCFSSWINGSDFISDLYVWTPLLMIVLIVATAYENHLKELLLSICIVTTLLCIVNLLSMVLYPEGMYETVTMPRKTNFFWGHRNASFMISLPAVASSLCLDALGGKRVSVRSGAIWILAFALAVVKLSVTSLFAVGLFFIGFALVQFSSLRKALNGVTILVANGLLFLGVVIFRIQTFFEPLFQLFGKNATLTMRTDIWDYVMSALADPAHVGLGYGMAFTTYFKASDQYVGSAHNVILHIMLLGGMVALLLLIALCGLAAYRLYKRRTNLAVSYVALGFGAVLLIGLTENVATKVVLFLFLSLSYYASGKLQELVASEGASCVDEEG